MNLTTAISLALILGSAALTVALIGLFIAVKGYYPDLLRRMDRLEEMLYDLGARREGS